MVLYPCPKCGMEFNRKSNFETHLNKKYDCVIKNKKHEEKSELFQNFPKSFQNFPKLENHVSKQNNNIEKVNTRNKNEFCESILYCS
jgi:uncharacterized C2H2 Zn-finger protein